MRWFTNRLVTVQTIFFVFILLYCLATLIKPETSSARYISLITNGYKYPLALCCVSILFAVVGLFRSLTPLRMWVFLLPFILYCGTAFVGIAVSPSPSLTGMVNFAFIICVAMAITWKKING